MPDVRTLILIAHDRMVPALGKLMRRDPAVFQHYRLLATTETGEALEEALPELEVTHVFPGRKGGEIQLCGLVCSNSVAAVIFLRDPVQAAQDEPDVAPFYRACDLNNVPLATNIVGAAALLPWLGRKIAEEEQAEAVT